MGVRKPLKSKFQHNHGHSGRLTQGSAKIPQAGRAVLIYSKHRLRNDNVGLRFIDFLSNLCFSHSVDSIVSERKGMTAYSSGSIG